MLMQDTRYLRPALALLATLALDAAAAQDKIWRCGNEYTNQPGDVRARGCKPVEGGNLTVIEGLKPQPAIRPAANPPRAVAGSARSEGERVDSAEQRARDADARAILEAELRKAEDRLVDLRQQARDADAEKRPEEQRNPLLQQQRTVALRDQVVRAEADVAAIRRELARAPASEKR